MKKTVRRGSLSATLTQLEKGVHLGSWKVTYRDASGKIVSGGVLKSLEKAKDRAEEILDAMNTDTIRDLTPAESSLIRRIRSAGVTADALTATVNDLASIRKITVMDAVAVFLEREVETANYSVEQANDYRRVTGELVTAFGWEDLTSVTGARIESWGDGWKVGAKRYNNKRTIVFTFFRWAVGRNYITKNPAEGMRRKRLARTKDHAVFTPKQFAKLLVECPESHLPWLALSGFAGMRGVEIYGRRNDRSSGLKWEEIDWKRNLIVLSRTSAKQTSASKTRLIPLCPALADWLRPWKNKTGPVYPPTQGHPYSGHESITERLGKHVGGAWPSNALRASRASYRMAECQSIATVTLEMGHSAAILTGTYLNPRFEDDAAVWFSLDREKADSLACESIVIPMMHAV